MRSKLIFITILGLVSHLALGQLEKREVDSLGFHQVIASSSFVLSAGENLPFWLYANNSNRLTSGNALGLLMAVQAKKEATNKTLDYFYGLEAQGFAGAESNAALIQSYAGLRIKVFDLQIGMREEFLGLNDSTLSVGNLTYGNNARPIPKVVVSTPNWVATPILGKVFSFKAYMAHGWFEEDRYQSGAMLHQKYLYLRGRAFNKKLEVIGGLHHNAQWGGENLSSETRQPTGLRNFARIIAGLSGGEDALRTDQNNALGNHLGSYDLSASYDFGKFIIRNNWQLIWEDKSGLTPYNWKDGLIGFSIKLKDRAALISGFNIELVRTSHQDATKNDGDLAIFEPDNFYNNGVYRSGWTFNGNNIGHPMFFILNPESISVQKIKNTVNALNLGLEGVFEKISYTINYQSIKNHGTLKERIDPGLRLNLLGVDLIHSRGPHSFGLRGTVQWGNYPGKNAGLQFTYSRSLRL